MVVVDDGDPVPPRPTVVRVRTTASAAAVLDRLAGTPDVIGILWRSPPDALGPILDAVLPAARRSGVLAAATGGTLRERLGLPAPGAPDLSGHPLAFESAPNPGGRL
ncbi:hypothetical protein ACWDTP_05195 [Mycobacterium sp. NPDC003449]